MLAHLSILLMRKMVILGKHLKKKPYLGIHYPNLPLPILSHLWVSAYHSRKDLCLLGPRTLSNAVSWEVDLCNLPPGFGLCLGLCMPFLGSLKVTYLPWSWAVWKSKILWQTGLRLTPCSGPNTNDFDVTATWERTEGSKTVRTILGDGTLRETISRMLGLREECAAWLGTLM